MDEKSTQRPILIYDAMNSFVRAYAAFPAMNVNGEAMGGCVGFLKTLRKLVNEYSPSAVYIAWEGGGSQRRRALFSEYKMNRRPEKLNRFYEDDLPDSEENRQHQLIVLLGLMKFIPACQLYVSDCEGDDLVAYLARQKFKNVDKIIASSDKDMYQLLDERTKIYSFHKKIIITGDDILQEYKIKPGNFGLAKALCGDPSDNIPGLKGFGFKTASRVLPFLQLQDDILVSDVIDYCNSHYDESKLYQRVVENQDLLKRNWRLVHLDGSMLSAAQASKVDQLISTYVPRSDRISFTRGLMKEGINDFDVADFFMTFNCIENVENRTKEK